MRNRRIGSIRSARPVLVLLLGAGIVASPLAGQSRDESTRRIDVGGYRLALRCVGEGSPTVVIDGGAGAWSVHYRHLQDALAETTRACTYDRAGFGASDPSPNPRTSDHMAAELATLLEAAGETDRLVLVGHSLGGYNVRIFAHEYRERVAGVVLMESGHEHQFERLPPQVGEVIAQAAPQFRALAEMARLRQLPDQPIPEVPVFATNPELRAEYAHAVRQPSLYETSAAEMAGAPESARRVGTTRPLDALPLAVVTAGNSFAPYAALGIPTGEANAVWLELQSEFLDLSTNAVQLIAPEATHQIGWDEPDFVVAAVKRVIRAARRGEAVASAPDPSGVGSHLERLWKQYLELINDEALEPLMEYFSPDAVLMPPNQPAVYGVEGARAWFGALFDGFEVELDMPTLELHVHDNWALRRGTYEVSLTLPGQTTTTDQGKFVQVWERQGDGLWRIVRGMLNSDLPPPASSISER